MHLEIKIRFIGHREIDMVHNLAGLKNRTYFMYRKTNSLTYLIVFQNRLIELSCYDLAVENGRSSNSNQFKIKNLHKKK